MFTYFQCYIVDVAKTDIDHELVILLDASDSIGQTVFMKVVDFTQNFVRQLPFHYKIALIRYSSEIDVISGSLLNLLEPGMRESLLSQIAGLGYIGGTTATDIAINQALLLFSQHQLCEVKKRKVLLIVTDGNSNNLQESIRAAEHAKRGDCVHIYTLGVGKSIHKRELQAIASHPLHDYFFMITNFDDHENVDLVVSNLLYSINTGKELCKCFSLLFTLFCIMYSTKYSQS